MTAEAIFHLGALLIPFDMAAVAILAGRSWEETLLLTAVTSVTAWYGIERAVPSKILLWCARLAVVMGAAGVAAVSTISMPIALATAAVVAITVRKPVAAGFWAIVAGLLPVGAFVAWLPRIADAMADLGFDSVDRWQLVAAGVISTLVLVVVTRTFPRVEIAWSAVTIATVTGFVTFDGFGGAHDTYLVIGALFAGLELLALGAHRDPLWKPIVAVLAVVGEVVAAGATAVLLADAVLGGLSMLGTTHAFAAAFFAIGWLIADHRRLEDSVDWIIDLILGSDWPVTTVMFPAAVLAIAVSLSAPVSIIALTAVGLAFWMIATWRSGAAEGATLLVLIAAVCAQYTDHWTSLAIGAAGAAVLMLGAQQHLRTKNRLAALVPAFAGAVVWLGSTSDAVAQSRSGWPVLLVLGGAWMMSWIVEARGPHRSIEVADWIGRATAGFVLVSAVWEDTPVAVGSCALIMALAILDYLAVRRRGAVEGHPLLTTYALIAGAAFGLAGMPLAIAATLSTTVAGAVLAVAGFVLVGVALGSPRFVELPLAAAAVVASSVGVLMAWGDPGMFAVALLAVGCSILFVAAALRDLLFAITGYIVVGLGVALQLAVWEVIWLEPYLVFPVGAALYIGYRFHRSGGNSWAAYAPTIALMSYVSIADRLAGGSAWHTVIAGAIGVLAIIAGGYRRLVGPLVTGSVVLAVVVGYESLGPASLVPTWAWLATGGTILLAAGVAMERSDTTPLERGQQLRTVVATQFS